MGHARFTAHRHCARRSASDIGRRDSDCCECAADRRDLHGRGARRSRRDLSPFDVPPRLAVLLAVGTAVCGCTAVIAVAPAIRARNEETAFAITCVVLFGCVAMLTYPSLAAVFFSAAPIYAGMFLGTAIHDTTQVIGAALIYCSNVGAGGPRGGRVSQKLLRNLSIVVPRTGSRVVPRVARALSEDAGPLESGARVQLVPLFERASYFAVLRTAGDTTRGSGVAAG